MRPWTPHFEKTPLVIWMGNHIWELLAQRIHFHQFLAILCYHFVWETDKSNLFEFYGELKLIVL